MKNVIITGADGFVGSYTTNYFLEHGMNVLAIDIIPQPKRLKENKNLTYIQLDINDIASLENDLDNEKYDTFVHFAWEGSAGPLRADYNIQIRNALNSVECVKLAKKIGCNRFVCAGSIMEYEVEYAVHKQGNKPGMGYIYGMGKHIAHCMSKSVAADIGIDLIWPMITNAYGVGEVSPRFVNTTLRKIINNEPLKFTSAIQNYDFVYITDVAKAFYLIAKNGNPFCEYLIGSSDAKPLKQFILELRNTLAPDAELEFGDVPFTGVNMPLSVFDATNTENDCGFRADVSFSEGVKLTMDWLKSIEQE